MQKQKESVDVKEADAAESITGQVKAEGCDKAKPAPVCPKPKESSNVVSPPIPSIDSKVQKKSHGSKTA